MTTLTFKIFGIRFTLTNERGIDAQYDALIKELGDKSRNAHVMQRLAVYRRALKAGEPRLDEYRGAVLRAAQ